MKDKKKINYAGILVIAVVASIFGVMGKSLVKNSNIDSDPITVRELNRTSFVDSCIKSGGSNDVCSCVFESVVNKFGLDKFIEYNHKIITNGKDSVNQEYVNFIFSEAPSACSEKYK